MVSGWPPGRPGQPTPQNRPADPPNENRLADPPNPAGRPPKSGCAAREIRPATWPAEAQIRPGRRTNPAGHPAAGRCPNPAGRQVGAARPTRPGASRSADPASRAAGGLRLGRLELRPARMWPAAGRVSSGVAGRARVSRRLGSGAAGWPGRAATASRPAGHPASHAEKRAGRLEKTGWPTGRPAGQNRLADRLAGRPAARPDHSVECAGCSKSGSGELFLPIFLADGRKNALFLPPRGPPQPPPPRQRPRPLKPTTYRAPVPRLVLLACPYLARQHLLARRRDIRLLRATRHAVGRLEIRYSVGRGSCRGPIHKRQSLVKDL